MTNRADLWLGNVAPLSDSGNVEARGMDTVRLIQARPATIVVSRLVNNSIIQLAPQIVRLDAMQLPRESNEMRDALMAASKQYIIITGCKDNPFLPDTNLLRADQFFYLGLIYEVIEFVNTVPGRLLASGSAMP